jgi:hypothetical protein
MKYLLELEKDDVIELLAALTVLTSVREENETVKKLKSIKAKFTNLIPLEEKRQ